jgi:hypothetical protein
MHLGLSFSFRIIFVIARINVVDPQPVDPSTLNPVSPAIA